MNTQLVKPMFYINFEPDSKTKVYNREYLGWEYHSRQRC